MSHIYNQEFFYNFLHIRNESPGLLKRHVIPIGCCCHLTFHLVKSESLSVTELATSFMDRKTTGWIRDLHPIESEDFDLDELSDEDFHIRELKKLRDSMMEEIDARLDKPGFE